MYLSCFPDRLQVWCVNFVYGQNNSKNIHCLCGKQITVNHLLVHFPSVRQIYINNEIEFSVQDCYKQIIDDEAQLSTT